MSYQLIQGDAIKVMADMPADSVELCFFSPPYETQRTYSINFDLAGQAWVDWMVQVFGQCQRVCKGLVACVCQGRTRDYRWSAVPALLIADLHRAGFNLRNPPIFHRVGIPGSGGPDWLRGDYEWIVCTASPGKLPWSDNTAMGHPPKWEVGGAMSYRNGDGVRKNESNGPKFRARRELGRGRRADGSPKLRKGDRIDKRVADGTRTGGELQTYDPPAVSNPGNSIEQTYTAGQVAELLQLEADWRHHIVGGGVMGGDEFSSRNEAPFPEPLAEFFIRSFCPEGGRVLDPTVGSGTTIAVAHRWKRHGIGIDIRPSQIELATKRCEAETPLMWA